MPPIVKVENLSKKYLIRHKRPDRYHSLREVVMDGLSGGFRRIIGSQANDSDFQESEEFWALRSVDLEINQGDCVGIIGRNGAGKSTLLKLLSRITEPSGGTITLRGRVASLLEVGTGFHPELTGRENIYLNGALLGMRKVEIRAKFDEIVDFAEVEQFLDTPVKRYSSGMYVRLAFAVAAHLESEILIVDEVLAVGDAQFQKKCLGQMEKAGGDGRTVLFVSHNMKAVSRLCSSTALLSAGQLISYGRTEDVTSEYLSSAGDVNKHHFSQDEKTDIPMCLLEACIETEEPLASRNRSDISRHDSITVSMTYLVARKVSSAHVYVSILGEDESVVFGTSDADMNVERFGIRNPGVYNCEFTIPKLVLNEGRYRVNVSMGIPYQVNYQENIGILTFNLVHVEREEGYIHHKRAGSVWLDIPWRYEDQSGFVL